MEDYVLVIISLASMFTVLMGVKMFRGETKPKQVKREVQDSAHKEVISSKDLTITTLKDELRSIKGKMYRTLALEAENGEELTENGGKPVTWEEITSLVKASYPQHANLLPLFKKQIMDVTSGMSMEEILSYVKQIKGNQQPQEGVGISPDASGYRADWA